MENLRDYFFLFQVLNTLIPRVRCTDAFLAIFLMSYLLKSAACLKSSADTGKGQSKLSSTKVSHGFHLVKGKSGHDMEDYHVAQYSYENNHELGLFAIFDGHMGDSVPSYLKANLFNNILEEVFVLPFSPSMFF